MRVWIKRLLFALMLLLLIIQFVDPTRVNPPIDPPRTIHAALSLDPVVASTLARSCNDCHSNSTAWPWYRNVAPVSWLVTSDAEGAAML
jgi:hypothetical protein